ncbi:MAG: hypothetical protein AVDCRST_MAG14-1851, partial [uncultured Rubrobacteraceae bacterium]
AWDLLGLHLPLRGEPLSRLRPPGHGGGGVGRRRAAWDGGGGPGTGRRGRGCPGGRGDNARLPARLRGLDPGGGHAPAGPARRLRLSRPAGGGGRRHGGARGPGDVRLALAGDVQPRHLPDRHVLFARPVACRSLAHGTVPDHPRRDLPPVVASFRVPGV